MSVLLHNTGTDPIRHSLFTLFIHDYYENTNGVPNSVTWIVT
jgi:hypothetical protein